MNQSVIELAGGIQARRLWAVWLGLGLALAGAGGCKPSGGTGREKARPLGAEAVLVAVAPVVQVPLEQSIPIVGTLYPKDESLLAAEVEGHLEKAPFEFGDRLEAGKVVAEIDPNLYEAQLGLAQANVARARAAEANAVREFKRVQTLQKDSIASASELDQAQAQVEVARAEVKAAEAAEAVARLNLRRSKVVAPFDAGVADRVASRGDYLKVGAPIYRLVNDAELKFIFQVPERHASEVKAGMEAQFRVDNWPGLTFTGRVYLIGPSVNLAPRAFNVGALVPNPDRKLKAGTFARGRLIVAQATPAVVVPIEAVVNFAGVTKAFVVSNDVAFSREIKLGRLQGGHQEILTGLQPGDTVVVTGQTRLYDGAKVRLKETPK